MPISTGGAALTHPALYASHVHSLPLSTLPSLPPSQYAKDFYIGQWLRDTDVELEKAMKGSTNAIDDLSLEDNVPAISSSAVALQQAEVKKGMLHSLISSKAQASLKSVGVALSVCSV